MKKSRLPFDIEFLLESILDENPDTVNIHEPMAKTANNNGADIMPGRYNWEKNFDAVPFYIDDEDKVIIFCKMGMHGRMENALSSCARLSVDPILFADKCVEKEYLGCPGIYVKIASIPVAIYFFGLEQNNYNGIREYIKKHRHRFRNLAIRDGEELCGRMWKDSNIISFWNEKNNINLYFQLVFKFMKQAGMDPKKCAYEFADSKELYTYNNLKMDVAEKDKLSPEELHALQAKKHLDKSKSDYGDEYWQTHSKKAAKGFDYAAKATDAIPSLEGHIKLKDLLKENPDSVMSQEDTKIAHYADADAIAFFAFKEFSILNIGGVHYDIINTLKDIYENLEDYTSYPDEVESAIEDGGLIFSSAKGLLNALHTGKLGNYFKNYINEDSNSGSNKSRSSSENIGGFRIKSGGLAGRIWNKKKIISFWNKKEIVISRWTEIEKMFSDLNSTLGNLSDYKVDWLEREFSVKTPLTSASDVSASSDPSKNQDDFLDTLFGNKKISDEDIKKLQARLHTMSAKEKKKVMMDMGYKNTKAADIADKLNMTVAEFNNIMNVNEGDI